MANVVVKGVRQTDGRKTLVDGVDAAVRADLSSIVGNALAAANGIATLNGASLVVQNPASTSAAAVPSTIVLRDTNADVLVPSTPTNSAAATSKTYVDTLVTHLKGQATYAGTSPIYSELNALLPNQFDFGYFYKGATDSVFHAFRRSTSAGTVADFGIVEMS